jgi:hypothetical protein
MNVSLRRFDSVFNSASMAKGCAGYTSGATRPQFPFVLSTRSTNWFVAPELNGRHFLRLERQQQVGADLRNRPFPFGVAQKNR